MSRLETIIRVALRCSGVRSRDVETEVARHHVYDAPGSGELPTIVVLPGLGDSAVTALPMLPRLRRGARRVVIVESAGHGLSGQPRGAYTVARHFASVTTVLDTILDEPAIVLGNSLGGATALHYASARPERVRGLYLTSPAAAPFDDDSLGTARRAFLMRDAADARAFVELVFHRAPAIAPVLARLLLRRARTAPLADILDSAAGAHATPAELAALAMPITLLWGRSERLLPPSALGYLRAHLPAHASILEPDGIGHCPHLDAPDRLALAVCAFGAALPG